MGLEAVSDLRLRVRAALGVLRQASPEWVRVAEGARRSVAPGEGRIAYLLKAVQFSVWSRMLVRTGPPPRLRFEGLGAVRSAQRRCRPRLYLLWHHSVPVEPYAIAQVDPRVRAFTREGYVIFGCRTEPVSPHSRLALLRMAKLLLAGEPVAIVFDGLVGDSSVQATLFGVKTAIRRGVADLIRLCTPAVLPVTCRRAGRARIVTRLGPPLYADGELRTLTDVDIVQRALEYFTEELRAHGAAQVYLPHLADRARERG